MSVVFTWDYVFPTQIRDDFMNKKFQKVNIFTPLSCIEGDWHHRRRKKLRAIIFFFSFLFFK